MNNKNNEKWTFDEIKKTIKVLKDNEVYRISDNLKFKKNHMVVKELISNPKYKNTLLYEHHTTTNSDFYKVMLKKKEKSDLKFYDDDTLVVHIRSGDVFNRLGLGLKKNFDFYLNEINKSDKKKIVLVTALHYGTSSLAKKLYKSSLFNYNVKNHDANIEIFHKFISSLNKPVEISSNDNVDEDLLLLVFCKNLVTNTSSGGFSKVIKKYNDQYNSSKKK